MFAAVAAHKFVIAFCIGVELMVTRTKLWLAFLYVVVYSIVSFIGKFKKSSIYDFLQRFQLDRNCNRSDLNIGAQR